MRVAHVDEIHQINYLTTEMGSLYHQISLKLGVSDSVGTVLYAIYDAGNVCLLSDIYKKSGISKQTIHSAIRSLEANGILYLESYSGRAKRVVLTDLGKEYVQKTAEQIYRAEMDAFETWTEAEISTYIRLMGKYVACFRQKVQNL